MFCLHLNLFTFSFITIEIKKMAIGITLLSDDKKDVITRYKELIIMRRAHWSNRPFFFTVQAVYMMVIYLTF